MSCFRFSLSVIVMIPLNTADVVVVPALSFTVGPMFERSSKAFKGIPAPVCRIFRVPLFCIRLCYLCFSHGKIPVVIRFFSFSAWLSMTAPLRRDLY